MSDGEASAARGPAQSLAAALGAGLRDSFAERAATAQAFAELLLDATEAALPLAQGDDAAPALRALELLATRLDLYEWDGPPGWDEILARGLRDPAAHAAVGALGGENGGHFSPLDGIGDAADRAAQLAQATARARAQAERLIALGRRAAQGATAGDWIALHSTLLRLVALSAAAAPLALPEAPGAGALPPPGEAALVAEMDARAAAHSDFESAQDEWLARLQHDNPTASAAGFRTFFAGIGQSLRVAVALRRFRDEALAGRAADDCEALVGAVGGWQPVRWAALHAGAPAEWWAELFPAAPGAALRDFAALASECSAALDCIGRLWTAQGLSLAGFCALAAASMARTASALALWQELR